jgi:hypothetical protein
MWARPARLICGTGGGEGRPPPVRGTVDPGVVAMPGEFQAATVSVSVSVSSSTEPAGIGSPAAAMSASSP